MCISLCKPYFSDILISEFAFENQFDGCKMSLECSRIFKDLFFQI